MKWNHEPGPTLSNSEEKAPIGYNSQIVPQQNREKELLSNSTLKQHKFICAN